MSWRIEDCVIRGELDCRVKGVVTGTIWLRGHGEPLRLNLAGHPLGDLAGCLLSFVNTRPQPSRHANLSDLASDQTGIVGDMTASFRVQIFDVPFEKIVELGRAQKEIPMRQANALHIEWFSEKNGRVIIESTDYQISITAPPLWQLSQEEDDAQYEANAGSFRKFLEDDERKWTGPDEDGPDAPPAENVYDEFKWERMLKESDEKSDKLGEVMQRYDGHPDSERLIAREMKWTWVEDELDAEERGIYDDEDEEAETEDAFMESDDFEDLKPNPLTEGRDWIRDEDGDIQHPLSNRAFKLGMRMWRYADEFNLINDEKDPTVHEMVMNTQICSAKLAGALNELAYDFEPEPGLVVASLKRALNHLHVALRASDMVKTGGKIDAAQIGQWRAELFAIREEIIRLMNEHRSKMQ